MRETRGPVVVLVAALVAALATGCGSALEPEWTALEDAERQWTESGPDHYAFTYREVCFCPSVSARVEVVDGEVVSVERTDSDEVPRTPRVDPVTIDALLAQIRTELDRRPHDARVAYGALGVPVDAFFDYHEHVVDEEWGFVVEDFEILP